MRAPAGPAAVSQRVRRARGRTCAPAADPQPSPARGIRRRMLSIPGLPVRRLEWARPYRAPGGGQLPEPRKEPQVSKFLFLYKGPATPMEDYTPEQSAEQMQAWGAWMGKVGPAMADPGP